MSEARRFIVAALDGRIGTLSDQVALVTSELATNAVRHAGGDYEVTISVTDDEVTVAVFDSSAALPVLRVPDPKGGHGLAIIQTLATVWAAEPMPGVGKVVWAQLHLPE